MKDLQLMYGMLLDLYSYEELHEMIEECMEINNCTEEEAIEIIAENNFGRYM